VNALSHVVQVARPGQILISGADTGRGPTIRISAFDAVGSPAPAADESLEAGRRLLEMQGGALAAELDREGYRVTLTLPSVRLGKVLVVDDNPDVVMLFQRYLRGAPYRVVQATSGQEAVRLGRELSPDVITLDVMLPSQDGWEILAQLRAYPQTRETPVIVCSVLPEREVALALGAADFLAKPITRTALLQALDRCLAGPGSSRARS
jgi:CheY-like chemotaxis protein